MINHLKKDLNWSTDKTIWWNKFVLTKMKLNLCRLNWRARTETWKRQTKLWQPWHSESTTLSLKSLSTWLKKSGSQLNIATSMTLSTAWSIKRTETTKKNKSMKIFDWNDHLTFIYLNLLSKFVIRNLIQAFVELDPTLRGGSLIFIFIFIIDSRITGWRSNL